MLRAEVGDPNERYFKIPTSKDPLPGRHPGNLPGMQRSATRKYFLFRNKPFDAHGKSKGRRSVPLRSILYTGANFSPQLAPFTTEADKKYARRIRDEANRSQLVEHFRWGVGRGRGTGLLSRSNIYSQIIQFKLLLLPIISLNL